MDNRRDCIRCVLPGISLEPTLCAETVDVSETGLAWRTTHAHELGDTISLDAPALFEALGLSPRSIEIQVCDVAALEDGQFRVGARFVRPPDMFSIALRRTVLRLQRQGKELAYDVVDVLVMPHA